MNVKIIISDSLGARSMATYIEKYKIIIDPGIALGPKRFNLPPSNLEYEILNKYREKILKYVDEANYVVISHYHYDHYMKDFPYEGKILFLKDYKNNINNSQKIRAKNFLKICKGEVNVADNLNLEKFGIDGEISFPVFHGSSNKLGYVVCTRISNFVHCSDIQGFSDEKILNWLKEQNFDTIFLSGFPTYLIGILGFNAFENSKKNFEKFLEETNAKKIILDHHIARDKNYVGKIEDIINLANNFGIKIMNASMFNKEDPRFYEAFRNLIFKEKFEEVNEKSKEINDHLRRLAKTKNAV